MTDSVQPERLSAERLAEIREGVERWRHNGPPRDRFGNPDVGGGWPDATVDLLAEVDALRSTIADLEAERDRLGEWLAKERDLKEEAVSQIAADTPKLRAARRWVEAKLLNDHAVEVNADAGGSRDTVQACNAAYKMREKAAAALVAAFSASPEATEEP